MSSSIFREAFVARIRRDWNAAQVDNLDVYRFPHGTTGTARWRRYALKYGGERARSILRALRIVRQSRNLQWVYNALADDASRHLLIDVLAFRALGWRHVRLPLNTPDFWHSIEMIQRDLLRVPCSYCLPSGECMDDYDLAPAGIPVQLRGHVLNVFNTFLLQQYRLARADWAIEVEPGDTVIDAGGCWGDTALYFAEKVGEGGGVYSYEFEAQNLAVFRHNMELNESLSKRIHLVRHPVWSIAGIELDVTGSGPNTRLTAAKGGRGSVTTDTIYELASREHLARVDFIKMDIEGAELDALKGSEATLRSHRPKLAISLYHKLEHFWEIPRYIEGLGLGYQFFIEHFTIHAEETMLFAVAPRM